MNNVNDLLSVVGMVYRPRQSYGVIYDEWGGYRFVGGLPTAEELVEIQKKAKQHAKENDKIREKIILTKVEYLSSCKKNDSKLPYYWWVPIWLAIVVLIMVLR